MRRKRAISTLALVAICAGLLALAAPAPAQTTTTTTTTTTLYPGVCGTLTGTQNAGTVSVGQRFVVTIQPTCVYQQGSNVRVTVNGTSVGNKRPNAAGHVPVDITAISSTQFSVDDPVITPAVCGENTVVGVGPGERTANNAEVTQTVRFTLNCGATTTVAATRGGTALTGANVLRLTAVALGMFFAGGVFLASSRLRRSGR